MSDTRPHPSSLIPQSRPEPLLSPFALKPGDTIGIFTPSTPAYADNPELFLNAIRVLERLGFRVKLGALTARRASQGYRAGTPEERAAEFMALIEDPEVRGLMSTLGGMNSNSLTPFLDFQKIRAARKVICGFSDVTSLHLAILKHARLRTFYGPALMAGMGEWPDGMPETIESFLAVTQSHRAGTRGIAPFSRWSNHFRNWANGDWKNVPREWHSNPGWRVLVEGEATGPLVALNLNTLVASAGTPEWPEFSGRLLLIEEMFCPMSRFERSLRQLERIGVFDQIAGLLVGKPEKPDAEGAPFDRDALLLEVLGPRVGRYPIVTEVDVSHTVPMHTVPQEVAATLRAAAKAGQPVHLELLEPGVGI